MKTVMWSVLVLVGVSISASASLVITNGDISGNAYTYSLTYDNILTKFNSDVSSTSGNVGTYDFGWGRAVGFAGTGGQFIYRFDFSGTGYKVTSVSISDGLQMYNWDGDSGTMVTAYSTDGSVYTTLSQCATPISPNTMSSEGGTTVVNFITPVTTVYYMATANGTSFYQGDNMWGRVGAGQTSFSAAFTLTPSVPEPATLALLSLGGLLLRRRK